jgi:transcriptional regulator of arginine metabolism
MNMIIIKTLPGMASAAASALDSMHLEECVGTIAGDDTIFAACPGIEEAKALLITINDMTEKG